MISLLLNERSFQNSSKANPKQTHTSRMAAIAVLAVPSRHFSNVYDYDSVYETFLDYKKEFQEFNQQYTVLNNILDGVYDRIEELDDSLTAPQDEQNELYRLRDISDKVAPLSDKGYELFVRHSNVIKFLDTYFLNRQVQHPSHFSAIIKHLSLNGKKELNMYLPILSNELKYNQKLVDFK